VCSCVVLNKLDARYVAPRIVDIIGDKSHLLSVQCGHKITAPGQVLIGFSCRRPCRELLPGILPASPKFAKALMSDMINSFICNKPYEDSKCDFWQHVVLEMPS
jgi:hypothetical protein